MRPHRCGRIHGIRREVPEGLAVVQPRLFHFFGGVGKVGDYVFVRLVEESVALFAEFFPRLGVDEFLEFGFELFLWGFFVAFREHDGFPSSVVRKMRRWVIHVFDDALYKTKCFHVFRVDVHYF